MSVKLRGHHLLCVLTYQSVGYTPEFVENYNAIVQRLNDLESVEIVPGVDDICLPVEADTEHHCHNESVMLRDQAALEAIGNLVKFNIAEGSLFSLTPETVSGLRKAFSNGSIRQACRGCQWDGFCTRIAKKRFREVLLFPGAV